MKKYVLFGIPAYGHINPTLAVVKELVDRGNQVTYYATDTFKEKIESTGADYRSYKMDPSYDNFAAEFAPTGDFLKLMKALLQVTESSLNNLNGYLSTAAREKPDCIIHDSLSHWGKIIGQRLGVPTVCSVSTFVVNKEVLFKDSSSKTSVFKLLRDLPEIMKIRGSLKRLTGVRAGTEEILDILMNAENLNIVYTSRHLQPRGDTFGSEYQFVGPSIGARTEEEGALGDVARRKQLLYISLGTINNQNTAFYQNCFEAFGGSAITVLMSVGKDTDIGAFPDIPPNFSVKNFVPQLEVLQAADAFITHGGMNSVHEALYYQVPLIVVPQQGEQQMVAKRVAELGAGIHLTQVTPEGLKNAVKAVLSEKRFKTAAEELSQSLKTAGGYKKAADLIEAYCSTPA